MGLIFLQGICGMSYGKVIFCNVKNNQGMASFSGLFLSSICEEEVQVIELAMGSVFPLMLASGVIWPLEGMPSAMRFISNFSPLSHAIEAMRCVFSRGKSMLMIETHLQFLKSFFSFRLVIELFFRLVWLFD